jgi:recombination protein RecR
MTSIEKLTELFGKFPGIGPRQAKRFTYYLLTRSQAHNAELADSVRSLKSEVAECAACHRFFVKNAGKNAEKSALCSIDNDPHRDADLLMIVSRDIDLESIEKSGAYKGLYFVLGGSVPILAEKPEERIRQKELVVTIKERLSGKMPLKEVILAVNATPEGEHTADYLERLLQPMLSGNTRISRLGKGVSTGTELEYSDSDTLTYALKNRS